MDCWDKHISIVSIWNNPNNDSMKDLVYLNEVVQGFILFTLIYYGIESKSLNAFQMIVTAIGVGFGFYVKIISKFEE